ncbi:hypothetical protein AYI70_g6233, partial [Smittium culicis]
MPAHISSAFHASFSTIY